MGDSRQGWRGAPADAIIPPAPSPAIPNGKHVPCHPTNPEVPTAMQKSLRPTSLAALLSLAILALAACTPQAEPSAAPNEAGGATAPAAEPTAADQLPTAGAIVQPLDLTAVKNMSYTLPDGQEVTLANGVYEEKPAEGAATSTVNLSVVDNLTAFGDLDGDGVRDASVILADAPGGSGIFMYLAAVRNDGGVPVNVSTVELGDRTRIDSNNIMGGVITLDVVAHGADDPLCCPTEQRRWTYQLVDGELKQASDELIGTVAPEATSELTPTP